MRVASEAKEMVNYSVLVELRGEKKVFAEETCSKCKKRVRKEDILE